MALVPWKRKNYYPMFNLFDNFVDRYIGTDGTGNVMALDVIEREKDFLVRANLPGFGKEDVKLTTHENQLIIEASREQKEQEKSGGKSVYKERYAGSYQRCVYMPEGVEMSEVKAKMHQGVLEVTIPKAEHKIKKEITIE